MAPPALSAPALPARARVVVVGGGVIGTSVAYHLAHGGERDVLLLERDRLTSGTTWHAAGLMVTFGSTSHTSTSLRQYTRDLYARLEAETGQSTGLKAVGFVEVATEPDRLEEYRRVAAFNRYCGVDVHEITAREVADLFPLARTDDVLAGFHVPTDGRANPVDVTMALAKGARLQGARIVEGCPVLDVLTAGGAVTGVRTPYGDVECEVVVVCAGMWTRQLAERSGVSVPLQAAEHYYLVTGELPGLSPDAPVLEDPGSYGYFREETGGLMVGLFEGVGAPWHVDGVPADASFTTIPPDWDRLAPYLERAMQRVPAAADAGVRTFFCGPESFTPDLQPLVGEVPEVRNYFVAAGMNSIGILTGGGIGRVVAHWVLTGRPDVDVTGIGVERLHAFQATPAFRRDRVGESLGLVYACHYPDRSPQTARGAKRSPLHDRLAAAGASFRDVSGWESPAWYAPPGDAEPIAPAGPGWGRAPWWAHWEAEHRAVREAVGLTDLSFMAKLRVQGRDAGRFLDHLSAGAVDGAPGVITYTQWLDEAGMLAADLTVTKLAGDDFLVVASDTAHRRVETWLRRRLAVGPFAGAHAVVTDVTSGLAMLTVQGPRSRELLQPLTSADLSDAAFGFRAARWIDLGYARVLCARITYVGELGYELYVPAEQAVGVHDVLVAHGPAAGLAHTGLKALSSLRLEKAYRDYGHDIDNTDTVLEAGLQFAVALDKPGGFVGRDAVAAQRAEQAAGRPLRRRLVQVLLRDPEPLLVHAEVVHRDGVPVGYVRAGSYGWTLGGAVGLAMVEAPAGQLPDGAPLDQAWLDAGRWEVDVAGRRVPATVSLRPLYDPKGLRVRA